MSGRATAIVIVLVLASLSKAGGLGIQTDPCTRELITGKNLNLDFGQLCRYESLNGALPRPTPKRVVYFGDSITQGWGDYLVSLRPRDVVNRGIGGQTTAQMLVRFRSDVINLRPSVVHILVGANDIAGNTGPTTVERVKDAIRTMTELAQMHGIRVILGSVLPARSYFWASQQNPSLHILSLNRWLQTYAVNSGHTYADYYTPLVGLQGELKSNFTTDGVHPNRAGYKIMNQVAAKALHQASQK